MMLAVEKSTQLGIRHASNGFRKLTDASKEEAGDLESVFRHRIEQLHKDVNGKYDPQADSLRIPRRQGFRPELAKQQNDDRQNNGLDRERNVQRIRIGYESSDDGRGNRRCADAGKIVS